MKHPLAIATAAAFLQLAGASAMASSASASLSDFQVRVVDLDPDDGIAAGVTFQNLQGGSFVAAGGASADGQSTSDTHYGGQPFGDASASGAYGLSGGTATLSGDAFGNGSTVNTSAFGSGAGNTGDGTAWLGDGSYAIPFTLAPDTRLLISGQLDTSATSTASDPSSQAFGLVSLQLDIGRWTEFSIRSYAQAGATTGADPLTATDSRHLDFFFDNPTLRPISGVFYGSLESSVSDLAPTTAGAATMVPEPAGATLTLAGLGLLAVAARRRRQRAR